MDSLSVGSLLQSGKYKILKVLGQGGFGITYLAEQVALGRKVAIKEFFIKDYCDRQSGTSHVSIPTENSRDLVDSYKHKFVKEAQMIASLRNPHIVSIHDIFEENGTAYYVMEYLNNGSLIDVAKKNAPLHEDAAIRYITQAGDALAYIHDRNILHLDVKPSNILLNDDGEVVLIDFGISKHYDESGGQTSTTPLGISKGYAPMEQYQQGSITMFSPATDVYSLGATLYFLLTGQAPPEAAIIYEDGLPEIVGDVSQSTKEAIAKAMAPKRKERYQNVTDFLSDLKKNTTVERYHPEVVNVKKEELDESTVILSSEDSNKSGSEVVPENESEALIKNTKHEKRGVKSLLILLTLTLAVIACLFYFGAKASPSVLIEGEVVKSATFVYSGGLNRYAYSKSFSDDISFSGVPDWCFINLYQESFSISCLSNDSDKERKADIQISMKGSSKVLATLKVTQEGRLDHPVGNSGATSATSDNGMSLSKEELVLKVGESATLTAYNYGSSLTWESDNSEVAVVSSSGKVTAVGAGKTNIWAHGIKYKRCFVTVTDNSSLMKKGYPGDVYINIGESVQLEIPGKKATKWESVNSSIATVSSTGIVTGLKAGDVGIWGYVNDDPKRFVIHVGSKETNTTALTTGSIRVSSDPSGAKIWIDGKSIMKTTPNTIEDLALGKHKLKLTLAGYQDYTGSFTIVSGDIVKVSVNLTIKEEISQNTESGGVRQESAGNLTEIPAQGWENGHQWVNLGLSVKWATCSLGASSPSGKGYYISWGEIREKDIYTWNNYKYSTQGNNYWDVSFTKYIDNVAYGKTDNKSRLELQDDAARQNWGGKWRIPTKKEFDELVSNSTVKWVTENGRQGCRITSKINGNSIFLPANGRYNNENGSRLLDYDKEGIYWSSTLSSEGNQSAWMLWVNDWNFGVFTTRREGGNSIWPVLD